MDDLAKLNNEEEEAVSGLANEGRESLAGKTIKHIFIGGRMRVVWSNSTSVKC